MPDTTISATDTVTVHGTDVGGDPGLYVEDMNGCSWEHPEDITEKGWQTITYSAQAVANPDDLDDLPLVEVSGYAPRSTVVGLAREIYDLKRLIGWLHDDLDMIRMGLSVAGTRRLGDADES